MNIGISLNGISHLTDSYRPFPRTYKNCYENFYKELYNPLSSKYNVSTYITTYDSAEIKNIINIYKPKKYQIFDYNNSHQIVTFIKSLEFILNEALDLVICTRFDLSFRENVFPKLNLDINKFNFLFKEKGHWENDRFVSDCVYIFPFNMIKTVIEACKDLLNNPPRPGLTDMHGLYTCLENRITANFINIAWENHMLSNENEIYKLHRL